MKIEQQQFIKKKWKVISEGKFDGKKASLVFVFGFGNLIKDPKCFDEIRSFYPTAEIISCSTAGEILDTGVYDETLAVTAVIFEKTKLKTISAEIKNMKDSRAIGEKLSRALPNKDLSHLMVFCDGLKVNGSELIKGAQLAIPEGVVLTGGMAGDEANFKKTYVGLNGPGKRNNIVLIGFYGDKLKIGHGSIGGWDCFGPQRVVTKSKNNVVYELDDQPVLDLYKKYLGDEAKDLPSSGLLFPLSICEPDSNIKLVRTMLSVNEKNNSIVFAGDVPEGSYAQLMTANFERLIDGAGSAADMSLTGSKAELAILISCVGRKLVLTQRTEEEVESVQSSLGEQCRMTGFYSYGEIAPTTANEDQCQLHNQTMTITTFQET